MVQEAIAPTLRADTTARVGLGTTLQQTGVRALVRAILTRDFHVSLFYIIKVWSNAIYSKLQVVQSFLSLILDYY